MRDTMLAAAAAAVLAVAAAALLPGPQPSRGHDSAPLHAATAVAPMPEYDYQPPAPGTYSLPAVKAAADGRVLDETGRRTSLRRLLDDRVTVLAFVYTRCADVCPQAMMLLHELHGGASQDPALRRELQLITLSFDPAYDTPEVMAEHAAMVAGEGSARWRFLTTAGEADLQPILDAYGQPLAARPSPDEPYDQFAHQLRVFLIDRDHTVRNIYSVGFLDPRLVLADVRTLLTQGRQKVAEQ